MNIINVKDLTKKYKSAKLPAVDSISFSVKEGEFFALLGPNGAGKTTTISVLTTTLSKTSGEVEIAGLNLDTKESEIREKIGIIFQKPSLDQNLSAEENLRFHAILYNLYPYRPTFSLMPEEYKKQVFDLAALLEIESDLNKSIKEYSGGMKRKLEIMRSLMHKPKVLFLDEPTSGLDPTSRKSLWRYIRDICKKDGTTVFLTTHYLDEAEGADRVCIMNKGKIEKLSTPESLKNELLSIEVEATAAKPHIMERDLGEMRLKYTSRGNKFKIELGEQNLQEFFANLSTPIDDIKVVNPTLEEAYIKLIEIERDI